MTTIGGARWPLLVFELGIYVLFAVCFRHAGQEPARRRDRLALLLTGTAYGLLLEAMTIYQFHAYDYGKFLVMLGGQVPLGIGVGWGIILYSAAVQADELQLPASAWAAMVGLLGLNVDATMDVVAIRLGMWNWRADFRLAGASLRLLGPDEKWFGVPMGNFFSWFIVLTSLAAIWRWLRPGDSKSNAGTICRSILALASSIVILGISTRLYVDLTPGRSWPVIVELITAGIVLWIGVRKASSNIHVFQKEYSNIAYVVPLSFHGFFIGMLLLLRAFPDLSPRSDVQQAIAAQFPILLTISLFMLLISIVGTHLIKRIYRNRED